MISNLAYISKNLYAFNQVRFKLICLPSSLSATDLNTKNFGYIINILTNKTSVCTKKLS